MGTRILLGFLGGVTVVALLIIAASWATIATAATGTVHNPIRVGDRGDRVCAAEYLLHRRRVVSPRRGFAVATLRGPHDCTFGPLASKAARDAYWRMGWPTPFVKSRSGGRFGPMLRDVLRGTRARPLAYRIAAGARRNRATVFSEPGLDARQTRARAVALDLIAHRGLVHYSQARRMEIVRLRLQLPTLARHIYEDCSSSTTGILWRAGYRDPNGFGYNGWGFTGTQAAHGRVVWRRGQSLAQLRVGDLVFYGAPPFRHVAMVIDRHGHVFTQGGESGPFNLPALYRSDAYSARRYS